MNGESSSNDKLESMLQGGSSEPHNVPLKYLRNITNNFSDEQLLGEGAFGTVYKGVLQNGETIAVKKLKSSKLGVRDMEFENEANHLMRLEHPNIVLLVGRCFETEKIYLEHNGKYVWAESPKTLLCLEYMPKGNLRGYLSDECSGLGWDTRFKIIEGICYGLLYLHEECPINGRIVHMDLKPENILLDNNMVPKLADFGLSRLFSQEKTSTYTTSRAGSLGYMSREYIKKGLISKKSDIFSLGVIIIEIVTGRRDYPDDDIRTSSKEFIEMVLRKWSQRKGMKTGVSLEVNKQQIRRCIQIGLECVKTDRSERPTISQIIETLHGPEKCRFRQYKWGTWTSIWRERERDCGTSIKETFDVALHQWQKKTALRTIRAIFTTVVFAVRLKKRAVAEPDLIADSDSDADADADSDSDTDAASASASDLDAASASALDSDSDLDVVRDVANVVRDMADAVPNVTRDVVRTVANALRDVIADVLRGYAMNALASGVAASFTATLAHALTGHVTSVSTYVHRIAFATASTVASLATSQMHSTTMDADVIRVRDVVLDRVLEALRPLAKALVDHVAACAAVSDADRIASASAARSRTTDSDSNSDSASASDSDAASVSASDSDLRKRTRTQPADASRRRSRSRKWPVKSRTRPAESDMDAASASPLPSDSDSDRKRLAKSPTRSQKRPANVSRRRSRSRKRSVKSQTRTADSDSDSASCKRLAKAPTRSRSRKRPANTSRRQSHSRKRYVKSRTRSVDSDADAAAASASDSDSASRSRSRSRKRSRIG